MPKVFFHIASRVSDQSKCPTEIGVSKMRLHWPKTGNRNFDTGTSIQLHAQVVQYGIAYKKGMSNRK